MIKIKSLQKKILKIMIPTFLMIFSFLFIPNVKAISSDTYDMSSWIDINEFTLPSKNINTEDYYIVIFERQDNLGYRLFYWTKNSDEFIFVGANDNDIFPKTDTITIKKGSYSNPSWKNLYYFDETEAYSKKFQNSSSKTGASFSSSKLIYTNIEIRTFGFYDIIWFDLSKVDFKSSYEFNEDINVTDISKIKVKFDLPEDTSNLYIDLKYKISQLGFGVGTLGDPYVSLKSIENDIEKTSISPKESFKNRDGIIEKMKEYVKNYYESINATHDGSENLELLIEKLNSISKYDEYKEINIEAAIKSIFIEIDVLFDDLYPLALRYVDEDYCSGTYIVNLLPDSTVYEYTFEVDVYNYEGSINLNFISNLNYEIEYEYKTEIEDYLTTINMKNYAALVLIPKVKNLETNALTSIQSDIYLSGIYDIELWEDVESKNVLYRKSNYSYNVFSHYQDYHYLNAILYFINKSIGDGSYYITFDSRYYNYTVKGYLSEEVEINNPNTNENINIGDISDLFEYGISESNKFTFNSFLRPIKFVFESISNFYNNYCPTIVQQFYYLIFMFFVVLVVIKIFL